MHMLEGGSYVVGVLWCRWPGFSEARDLFGTLLACLALHCGETASSGPTWDQEGGLYFKGAGMWGGI